MSQYDRHVREIHGHIIDIHRSAVLQSNAPAAGHSCSDSTVSGVNDDGQLCLRDDFVKRVNTSIVCMKLLQRWVKFESAHTQFDQPPRLPNGFCSAHGID